MAACLVTGLLLVMPVLAVANNLALLSGTLRTFQVASCDGDELRLECPPDTTVSINLVQYGRLASKPDLCGHPRDMEWVNNTDCMDRNALKVVIAECGGKQSCRLQTSPKAFGVDPCPGIRKFVEVLYKCQPSLFRSEVVCQGERRKISCDRSRIAIYSASFGVTEHGSIQCLQAPGVKITNCQASFTSEKMINQCQGRESCELNADPAFFNRPCPADHNTYLKVTYTCVPKKILREQYDQEDEEARQNATEVPPADRHLPSGKDAPSTPRSGKNNKEKFILYLTLSVTGGLLLCLLVVIGRLYCQRRRARQEVKAHYIEPPPHGFTDDISEVDADIDLGPTVLSAGRLSPPYGGQRSFNGSALEAAEPARYASSGRGTLRDHEHDTNPRSLTRGGPNVYYYS
ncbi:protein eva-1 homolog C-like isoform X2 [Pollicipes pollicipes]|uniref:protein eva-1 homolog C-like isoform X2 n=1 Tax=Pollicipes pollicipes TaxID=41117 RepID=UPI001884E3C2|nr:protein eva-1 homolog C-like isoform X2 [Pollicipes pollicipes]